MQKLSHVARTQQQQLLLHATAPAFPVAHRNETNSQLKLASINIVWGVGAQKTELLRDSCIHVLHCCGCKLMASCAR